MSRRKRKLEKAEKRTAFQAQKLRRHGKDYLKGITPASGLQGTSQTVGRVSEEQVVQLARDSLGFSRGRSYSKDRESEGIDYTAVASALRKRGMYSGRTVQELANDIRTHRVPKDLVERTHEALKAARKSETAWQPPAERPAMGEPREERRGFGYEFDRGGSPTPSFGARERLRATTRLSESQPVERDLFGREVRPPMRKRFDDLRPGDQLWLVYRNHPDYRTGSYDQVMRDQVTGKLASKIPLIRQMYDRGEIPSMDE